MHTELGLEIFDILALLNAFLGFIFNGIQFEKEIYFKFHIFILSSEF